MCLYLLPSSFVSYFDLANPPQTLNYKQQKIFYLIDFAGWELRWLNREEKSGTFPGTAVEVTIEAATLQACGAGVLPLHSLCDCWKVLGLCCAYTWTECSLNEWPQSKWTKKHTTDTDKSQLNNNCLISEVVLPQLFWRLLLTRENILAGIIPTISHQ